MLLKEESKDKEFAVKFYKRKIDTPFIKVMIRL